MRQQKRLSYEPLETRNLMAVDIIGDFGLKTVHEQQVADLIHAEAPKAILTVGDNNYGANTAAGYQERVGAYYGADIAANKFFPAPGNHDDPLAAYLAFFDKTIKSAASHAGTVPSGNTRYYDVIVDNTHFFIVNTETEPDGLTITSKQGQWLTKAIAASNSTYNIVLEHRPPYSIGSHGSAKQVQWLNKANLPKLDLSISGHDHDAEFFVVNNAPYAVMGISGTQSPYNLGSPIAGQKYAEATGAGYLRLTETSSGLKGEFVFTDKTVHFSFIVPARGIIDPQPAQEAILGNLTGGSTTEGGSIGFNFTLNKPAIGTVVISYTTQLGSASAVDLTSANGNLTFLPGEQTKQVLIKTIDDNLIEQTETFTVLASGKFATGTIMDNDSQQPPQPPSGTFDPLPTTNKGIVVGNASGFEGDTLNFTVSLANKATKQIIIPWHTTPGTATAGADYLAKSGKLTFLPGEQQKLISISTLTDIALEQNETFNVYLDDNLSGDHHGQGTIKNKDGGTVDPPNPPEPPKPPPKPILVDVHTQFTVTPVANAVIDLAGKRFLANEDQTMFIGPVSHIPTETELGPKHGENPPYHDSSNAENYPVNIRGTAANITIKNVTVQGVMSKSLPWYLYKTVSDGDGLRTEGSGLITTQNIVIDNVEDGFSPNGVAGSTYLLDGFKFTNIHDDGIEDDSLHSGTIKNGFMEGFSFLSHRPSTGSSGPAGTVTNVENVVVHLTAMPTNDIRNASAPHDGLGTGVIAKWSPGGGTLNIKNSTFLIDRAAAISNKGMEFLAGNYENVTIVWLGGDNYPVPVPTGVKIVTDIGVYTAAKNKLFGELALRGI